MNTEQELRRCPFCGGKAEPHPKPVNGYPRVMCTNCLARMSASTIEDAITDWNRRDEQAEVVAYQASFQQPAGVHTATVRMLTYRRDDADEYIEGKPNGSVLPLYASPPAVAAGGVMEALNAAREWINAADHDEHCFTNDPNPDACRCVCDKDSVIALIDDVTAALAVGDEGIREGWQPIETLPALTDMQSVMIAIPRKDNSEWIVGEATWRIEDDSGALWWAGTGPGDYYASPISEINDPPTHWQPLPAPPSRGAGV